MSTLRDELAATLAEVFQQDDDLIEDAEFSIGELAEALLASPPIARLVRVEAAARAVYEGYDLEHGITCGETCRCGATDAEARLGDALGEDGA